MPIQLTFDINHFVTLDLHKYLMNIDMKIVVQKIHRGAYLVSTIRGR